MVFFIIEYDLSNIFLSHSNKSINFKQGITKTQSNFIKEELLFKTGPQTTEHELKSRQSISKLIFLILILNI